MKKVKVGFFKNCQGAFTEERIGKIKKTLGNLEGIDFFDDLDFREFYVNNGRVFRGDFDLSELDIYFWHDSVQPMEWGGDNYFLNVLEMLGTDCQVINSAISTRITNDKFLAHSVLRKNNLPVVDFALVHIDDRETLLRVFNDFNKEILIKPRFGGWGAGILKINSEDQLFSSLELLKSFVPRSNNLQILIERYYPNDLSRWMSVTVFGDKVLLGYRKKPNNKEDWKIYDPLKKGGKGEDAEFVDPPLEIKKIALSASKAIGKDIIGFDFIFTDDGYKIVDENGRPGLYEHCLKSADIDIEGETVALILDKIKKVQKGS